MAFQQQYGDIPTGGPQYREESNTYAYERDRTTNNEVLPPKWFNNVPVVREVLHYRVSRLQQFMIIDVLQKGVLPRSMQVSLKILEFDPSIATQEVRGTLGTMSTHRLREYIATGNELGASFTMPTQRIDTEEGIAMYNGNMATMMDSAIWALVRNAYMAVQGSVKTADLSTYFGRRPTQSPVYLSDITADRNMFWAIFSKSANAIQIVVEQCKTMMKAGLRNVEPNQFVMPVGTRACIRRNELNQSYVYNGPRGLEQRLNPFGDYFLGNLGANLFESQPFPHEEFISPDAMASIRMRGDLFDFAPRENSINFNRNCNRWDIHDESADRVVPINIDEAMLRASGLWGWRWDSIRREHVAGDADAPTEHPTIDKFWGDKQTVGDFIHRPHDGAWSGRLEDTLFAALDDVRKGGKRMEELLALHKKLAGDKPSLITQFVTGEGSTVKNHAITNREVSTTHPDSYKYGMREIAFTSPRPIFNQLPNNFSVWSWLVNNDVQTPLRFAGFRPYKKYMMHSGFGIKSGPLTGGCLIGGQEFRQQENAKTREMHVHYNVEQLVFIQKPENVQIAYDVKAGAIIHANNGVGFFAPFEDKSKPFTDLTDKAIIIAPLQVDEKLPNGAISVTGAFDPEVQKYLSSEGKAELAGFYAKGGHYSTCKFINDAYGFKECSPFYDIDFSNGNSLLNTICEPATQLGVGPGPENKARSDNRIGTGHWGGPIGDNYNPLRFSNGRYLIPSWKDSLAELQGSKA